MTLVSDGDVTTPFSSGALARTLRLLGMPAEPAEAASQAVGGALGDTVDVEGLVGTAVRVLAERGDGETARRLKVRWWIRQRRTPFVVVVGGASGTGKSTVSQAAARALGIDTVLSTDMVRAVLRVTLHPELIPALSESSFSAQRMFRSNLEGNSLLLAFEQQASIVGAASLGLIRRMLKEGQQVVLNGVHVVPGLVSIPAEWSVFGYILTIGDPAEHERRFRQRFDLFQRDADHALSRMAAIRELDDYIVSHSRRAGVRIIESTTFDETVSTLVGALAADIEAKYSLAGPVA